MDTTSLEVRRMSNVVHDLHGVLDITIQTERRRSAAAWARSSGGAGQRSAAAAWPKRVAARPTSAREALVALDEVTRRLQAQGDPRAAFSDVYAIITRRVSERIAEDRGFFLEPAWISRLAGRFCELYLEALEAWDEGRDHCSAWTETHRYTGRRATLPIQEATLGLSAHINHDLALGIADNVVAFGRATDERMLARYKHDHDAVNRLLEEAVPEAFERLIQRHQCPASTFVYQWSRPAARWAMMKLLVRWRAQVWEEVRALLAAPDAQTREGIVKRMDRRARRIARVLTSPSSAYLALRRSAAAA